MSGFGFSPSDVVNAIELVVKARRALRDVGGAKDDFQICMIFLFGLEQTLKSVREHAEKLQDSTQVAVMAYVADIVEKHLSEKLPQTIQLPSTISQALCNYHATEMYVASPERMGDFMR